MQVRAERDGDAAAIRAVNDAALRLPDWMPDWQGTAHFPPAFPDD